MGLKGSFVAVGNVSFDTFPTSIISFSFIIIIRYDLRESFVTFCNQQDLTKVHLQKENQMFIQLFALIPSTICYFGTDTNSMKTISLIRV